MVHANDWRLMLEDCHMVRDQVSAHTTDARIRILATRFLLGRSYRAAEPITREPLRYAGVPLDSLRLVYERSLLGVLLKVQGEWGKEPFLTLPADHPLRVAVQAWLAVPESDAHRAKREAAMTAWRAEREKRRAAYKR